MRIKSLAIVAVPWQCAVPPGSRTRIRPRPPVTLSGISQHAGFLPVQWGPWPGQPGGPDTCPSPAGPVPCPGPGGPNVCPTPRVPFRVPARGSQYVSHPGGPSRVPAREVPYVSHPGGPVPC